MNSKVINIFSFNRPHYLGQVIQGIKKNNLEGWDVVLWQDGANNPFSKKSHAGQEKIEACVECFALAFPNGIIAGGYAQGNVNWGTGLTYMRAKEHTFSQYELALFIEDDLVPNHQYLDLLLKIMNRPKIIL